MLPPTNPNTGHLVRPRAGNQRPVTQPSIAGLAAALLLALATGACVTTSPGDPQKLDAARAQCERLYQDAALDPLRAKVRLRAGESAPPPSRPMLADASHPDAAQRDAVRRWEEVEQTCAALLVGAGRTTWASEDILARRMADLRWRLHAGEMSFGMFNAAYVDVQLGHYERSAANSRAWDRGGEIGAARAAEFSASMRQINTDLQLQGIRNDLNALQWNTYKTWHCDSSKLATNYYVYTCR